MKKKTRLIWHIYLSYLLIIVFALIIVSFYSSSFLEKAFLERTRKDLFVRGQLVGNHVKAYLNPPDLNKINEICLNAGRVANTRITIILADGKVVGDSEENPLIMENHKNRPEVLAALEEESGAVVRISETLRISMMYVAIAHKLDNKINAVIRTAIPVTEIEKTINSVQLRLLLVGFLVAGLASLISFFLSRYLSKPIEDMKKGAEKFAEGQLNHRLHSPSVQELASLADAMNLMAFQLEERIRIEENQKNEYGAVLSSMTEGVLGIDLDENIITINKAAREILNTGTGDLAGCSIQELVRKKDFIGFIKDVSATEAKLEGDFSLKNLHDRSLQQSMKVSPPRSNDLADFHINQENVLINIRSAPLRNSDNQRIGTLIVLNDVTHVRLLENVRQDFVANVSHEIKTPLTAIKGFVETLMLMEEKRSEDAERFLSIIMKHVERLDGILEDLLSLSRIEQKSRQSDIDTEKKSLKDIFETVLQLLDSKAVEKNISLEYFFDKNSLIELDVCLLEEALVNLVDNALKYSYKNTIVTVTASLYNDELIISVADQGPGIPEKDLSRIFERFYRVDKARSRKLGGTGLGLAIVKHIVKANGGYVSVESAVGKGSVFKIHLPF